MDIKEIVKEIIKENQETIYPDIIKRNIEIPLNSNKVIVITGPRRSGKTYLLYSLIIKLKNQNVSLKK